MPVKPTSSTDQCPLPPIHSPLVRPLHMKPSRINSLEAASVPWWISQRASSDLGPCQPQLRRQLLPQHLGQGAPSTHLQLRRQLQPLLGATDAQLQGIPPGTSNLEAPGLQPATGPSSLLGPPTTGPTTLPRIELCSSAWQGTAPKQSASRWPSPTNAWMTAPCVMAP